MLSIAVAVVAVLMGGCSPRPQVRNCSGAVWATTFSITYTSVKNLDDSILAVMKQVEMSLSPFAQQSLISAINRGESCRADSMISRVFLASQRVNSLSDGAFDPTVAPLVNLWGFGYDNSLTTPTDEQIDSVLEFVGIAQCSLRGDSIVKKNPLTQFNFSAITKGFGCDMVGEMLRRNGCRDYMIEIGGEIVLSGQNPKGEPWHIQIDAPVEAAGHQQLTIVELTDCAIATSGNYRNFREAEEGKTWHTISPSTGYPAVTTTLSATVIAPDCMTADALATACMAMNPADALKMIEKIAGVEALFVSAGNEGAFDLHATTGFPVGL